MTERKGAGVRALVAAGAALALSGCAATHVGDDWQCPIAQGEVCASVAAADPAVAETGVPETQGAGGLATPAALYRTGDGAATQAGSAREVRDAAVSCETGCGVLAWFEGLFARIAGNDGKTTAASERPAEAAAAEAVEPEPTETGVAEPSVPHASASEDTQRGAGASLGPGSAERWGGGLREPEVIGRVWIAPFVDAAGVYREGSWVRLVIAPATWRLP